MHSINSLDWRVCAIAPFIEGLWDYSLVENPLSSACLPKREHAGCKNGQVDTLMDLLYTNLLKTGLAYRRDSQKN